VKLVFTITARSDLQEIGDWIARDDPRRALAFVAEIEARCEQIATSPRAFP
jgi:toxin ParE1/3/4